jgi:hypothetical protein
MAPLVLATPSIPANLGYSSRVFGLHGLTTSSRESSGDGGLNTVSWWMSP